MTADRIKEIQSKTAFPDSVSVCQALLQVWNECEQERSYSEEIIDILDNVRYWETCPNKYKVIIEEWFEQFKNK